VFGVRRSTRACGVCEGCVCVESDCDAHAVCVRCVCVCGVRLCVVCATT